MGEMCSVTHWSCFIYAWHSWCSEVHCRNYSKIWREYVVCTCSCLCYDIEVYMHGLYTTILCMCLSVSMPWPALESVEVLSNISSAINCALWTPAGCRGREKGRYAVTVWRSWSWAYHNTVVGSSCYVYTMAHHLHSRSDWFNTHSTSALQQG